jgi:drug/metabolite transporter (DMT)-like permease
MGAIAAARRLVGLEAIGRSGLRAGALGLCAALIWGSYLAISKAGVNGGLTVFEIALFRYATAGVLMLPWMARHRALSLGGVGWMRGSILTLLGGPFFVIVGVAGYTFAPLAHGAVMQPAGLTLGSIGLGAILFRERIPRQRLAGILVMFSGLAFITGPNLLSGTSLTPLGDALFVSAGLMWAGFSILNIRWSIEPVAATAAVSVLSALIYVPVYFAAFGWHRLLAITMTTLAIQIFVQGVLSGVVAVLAFATTVQLIGPSKAAVFPALVPAAALLVGIPVTGERPTLPQAAGLCVVTFGLLLAISRAPSR